MAGVNLLGLLGFGSLVAAQRQRVTSRRWWPIHIAGPASYTRLGQRLRLVGIVGTWTYVVVGGVASLASLMLRVGRGPDSKLVLLPLISLLGAWGALVCVTYAALSLGPYRADEGRTGWWRLVPQDEVIAPEGQHARAVVASLLEVCLVICLFAMLIFLALAE